MIPRIEYVYEYDEFNDYPNEPPEYLPVLKKRILAVWPQVKHEGRKYVKVIYVCDHLDGVAGRAYKDGFAIAFMCQNNYGYGECTDNDEQLLVLMEHETAHVYDLNNPSDGKYELEEYARMGEPGNERWKRKYDYWYDTLTPEQQTRIQRQYYTLNSNAFKSFNRYDHPKLIVEIPNPVLVPYGEKDNRNRKRVKHANYILYTIRR